MSIHVVKDYVPTIIDSRHLLPRLASELGALEIEFRHDWPNFKQHPVHTTTHFVRATTSRLGRALLAPSVLAAFLTVAVVVVIVIVAEHTISPTVAPPETLGADIATDLTILNLKEPDKKQVDEGIGRNAKGRVGFQQSTGEGSGNVRRLAQGGGSGGARDLLPSQNGKLPPPSTILASIPKTRPLTQPSLPVAGITIDPALWKDLNAPVYGDPRSTSAAPSKGPGEGEGIGTSKGLGIGDGNGPGFGSGSDGNMGDNQNQQGCCGIGGSRGDNAAFDRRIFRGPEVEQRAKLLLKPEPQYTEEARRNQITGTVMLRVVFSSAGEVEQIRAVQTLPFGLTERAIAAAKQIRFVPATKGGRPVSMYMQLEYNFNLY